MYSISQPPGIRHFPPKTCEFPPRGQKSVLMPHGRAKCERKMPHPREDSISPEKKKKKERIFSPCRRCFFAYTAPIRFGLSRYCLKFHCLQTIARWALLESTDTLLANCTNCKQKIKKIKSKNQNIN